MYLDVCESKLDDIGIGKACEAIAKAYDGYVNLFNLSVLLPRIVNDIFSAGIS